MRRRGPAEAGEADQQVGHQRHQHHREPDAHDGRVVHVRLTAAGREALEAAAPGQVRCVRANLFDVLSPAQLAAFREVCTSMLDRLAPQAAAPRAQRSSDE